MFRAEGLSKSFGSLQVTDNISLSLDKGERHALIGPNGAGKTTLFNLFTGELAPDSGKIFLGERELTQRPPDQRVRAGLGRSFQRNNLFVDLNVHENLLIAHTLRAGNAHVFWRAWSSYPELESHARQSAASLGLQDELETPVKNLSYGTQRQLEIGLALARSPRVLLLDEPTAGMSPEETHAMLELLQTLPSELTLLIIEHDMDVAFSIAERITVLDYGRVLLEGTPREIRESALVKNRYLGENTHT